jgi:hypothetical protein
MQKSYIVKATLCVEDCQFYLRTGDVLLYDTAAQRLTVYRNANIVKVLHQTPLSMAGMVKAGIFEETTNQTPAKSPVVVPAPPAPATANETSAPSKSNRSTKKPKTVITEEETTPTPVTSEPTI